MVRVVGELHPAAVARRGGAHEGIAAAQDVGRPVAALRQPARAVRLDVGAPGQEAALHGRRVRPARRVVAPDARFPGTCSSSRSTRGVLRLVADLLARYREIPALYELDDSPGGLPLDRCGQRRPERHRLRALRRARPSRASPASPTSRRSCTTASASGCPLPGRWEEVDQHRRARRTAAAARATSAASSTEPVRWHAFGQSALHDPAAPRGALARRPRQSEGRPDNEPSPERKRRSFNAGAALARGSARRAPLPPLTALRARGDRQPMDAEQARQRLLPSGPGSRRSASRRSGSAPARARRRSASCRPPTSTPPSWPPRRSSASSTRASCCGWDASWPRSDAALARLDAGAYGICEECGKPITDARLEALPAARFCVDDQAKLARAQRNGSR